MNRFVLAWVITCLAPACSGELEDPATDAGPDSASCEPGTLDCRCEERGDDLACASGAVCDAATRRCRPALECEDLPCVAHQRCAPPGEGLDAACLSRCEPGFAWDGDAERCVATEATCEQDDPHSIAAQCADESRACVTVDEQRAACGGCLAGFVLESGQCREIVRCDTLFCADQNRECIEGDEDRDARCGPCDDGTIESDAGDCLRQSCVHDADGASLGATCDAAHRACVETVSGARCGDCYAGFTEVDGACAELVDCEGLDCSGADRLCETNDAGEASCGGCRAGYREVAGVCVIDPDATCAPAPASGSVLAACEAKHRVCTGGTCGDCEAGYYWDAARGACSESLDCEECSDANRECVSDNGAQRCGACATDHIVDRASGDCRPVRRCEDLDCAQGDICVEATAREDALCRTDCGERSIFNGSGCAPCPACTATDARGEPIELGFEPRATGDGECICQTAPGYFYSLAREVGTFPCDADGDGWVRQSAQVAYERGDPILLDNARCALRYIERFILVNERGDRLEVPLETPVPMFESDRNDDDLLLDVAWDRLGLPTDFDPSYVDVTGTACGQGSDCEADEVCRSSHCTAVASLAARALNPLTKYCHAVLTDYNDNGVADVEEWGERPTAQGEERRRLNTFSYFAELHTGHWEPSSAGSNTGAFVIAERTRAAGAGAEHAAVTYADAADDAHWRSCTLRRDAEWDQYGRPVGMDFASYEPNPDAYLVNDATPMWRGMTHHSQFKCLVVTGEPDEESPQEVSVADATAPSHELNACHLVRIEGATDVNPAHPVFECSTRSSPPAEGDVLWASVAYRDYPSAASLEGYVRGCVNGCAEARLRADARLSDIPSWDCPTADYGADNDGENLACTRDVSDHGKLVCLEACGDSIDNDGDGLVDDADLYFTDPVSGLDLATGEACDTSLSGVCSTGMVGCEARPGGALTCVPDVTPATRDLCDGLDNDCDGEIDEDAADPPSGATPTAPSDDPQVGQACDDPEHLGICREGMWLCRDLAGGGRGLRCESIRPTGRAETCNTLDDDCDGLVDEVADLEPPFGTSCTPLDGSGEPLQGVCAEGETRCVDGAEACVPLQAATREGRTSDFATCDTLDNDCDGQVDEEGACEGSGSYTHVRLVPKAPIIGDWEFNDHGPTVTVTATHQVVGDGLEVKLCAEFVETIPDHSTGRACTAHMFRVQGRRIAAPVSRDAELVYVDNDHSADVLLGPDPTEEDIVDDSQPGDLVFVSCVGDTDGIDIAAGTECVVSGNVRYRVQAVAP